MTTDRSEARRINKREFIARASVRSGQSQRLVSAVYEAIIKELLESVVRGEAVVLTGFGRFYRQDHKGHKVRFGKEDVDGYSVLKFSASRSMNRNLGEEADGLGDSETYELTSFGVPSGAELYLEELEPTSA